MRTWTVLTLLLVLLVPGCEGADGDTDDLDERPELPDIVLDGEDTAVLTPRFAPAGNGFYRMPWPSDFRTDTDGTVNVDDFPLVNQQALLDDYVRIFGEVQGYSSMPVIYLPFEEGPINEVALPEPSDTLAPESPVQLIRLGEGCGERIPVLTQHGFNPDGYQYEHTLAVVPVPGFVLDPGVSYAAVVLDNVAGDYSVVHNAELERMLTVDEDSRLSEVYAPLRECMDTAGLDASTILTATVFTVQDATADVRRIREFAIDPAKTAAPVITDWQYSRNLSAEGLRRTWLANYRTPIFQEGVSPYDKRGAFAFDADGEPVIQRWEIVPMVVSVPDVEGVEGPYPVLLWMGGTGHSRTGYLQQEVIQKALRAGFAVVSFLPQMHGSRAFPNSDAEIHSFNLINGEAGRTVFRQQAVDTAYFVRVIREALPGMEGLPELDTSKLVYGGHSQGALVGALVAALETEFLSYVLNGLGGYTSVTIVEREDYDFAGLISTFLGVNEEDLTIYHPVVQLIQAGAEPVDPNNYAAYWPGGPGNPQGNHVFVSNGYTDHTTFPRSMNSVVIKSGATPMAPAGWDVDPYDVWEPVPMAPPIEGNVMSSDGSRELTLATYMHPSSGHFTLYDDVTVQDLAVAFWVSSLDGTPVVDWQ